MTTSENALAWPDHKPTALLVLADGTVLEGFGLGAEGLAVGEVCFNTAMTGYEEILTDPSYAGRARRHPAHRDIRSLELPRHQTSRPVAARPRHYRPVRHRHPRADRADPHQGHAERCDRPRQEWRVRPAWDEGRGARMARPRRHGPGADGHIRPALHLGRDALGLGKGFWPAERAGVQ